MSKYKELTSLIIEATHRMQDMHSHCVQYHQETMNMLADAADISEQLGLVQLTDTLNDIMLSAAYVTGCVTDYEAVDAYEFTCYCYSDESVYNDSAFCDLSDYLN